MPTNIPLILASSSEGRKQLLSQLQLPFTTFNPNINEQPNNLEPPQELSLRLAQEKAIHSAKALNTEALYIGSDQVASLISNGQHQQLEKPYTTEKAIEQLLLCQGNYATFYTSLCLYNSKTKKSQLGTSTFTVKFRPLTTQQIERYVLKDQPLHCAGSFKLESLGISLFESLQGEDPNSLVGLPLIMLCDFLKNEGAFPL
ncbi:MAG: septum formation protein Maf [Sinobacterium sp.]|nr:septum formation protein Maf [Sinobacterium sp.]